MQFLNYGVRSRTDDTLYYYPKEMFGIVARQLEKQNQNNKKIMYTLQQYYVQNNSIIWRWWWRVLSVNTNRCSGRYRYYTKPDTFLYIWDTCNTNNSYITWGSVIFITRRLCKRVDINNIIHIRVSLLTALQQPSTPSRNIFFMSIFMQWVVVLSLTRKGICL